MALDAQFNAPGSMAAVYSDAQVAISTVRIIMSQPDQTVGFGSGRVILATSIVQVRRSEVAQPQVDDVFMISDPTTPLDGTQYRVISDPMQDVEGMTWSCSAEPA